MDRERKALLVSALASLLVGLVALVMSIASQSGAVLLDAAFNLFFFVTALLTLRVATLLRRPDDARYPFGYVLYEPLINLVKGLLILGACVFALVDAVIAIVHGGHAISAVPALAYAAGASVLSLIVLLVLRRASTKLNSPLIHADVDNWTVNAAITAAMAAAFVGAMALQAFGFSTEARYVDPVFICLVVAITGGVPIRMVMRSVKALLQRAPEDDTVDAVKACVEKATGGVSVAAIHVRAVRPGRGLCALIHIVIAPDDPAFNIQRADALRADIMRNLLALYDHIVADIVFTANPVFAEPTVGHAADILPKLPAGAEGVRPQ